MSAPVTGHPSESGRGRIPSTSPARTAGASLEAPIATETATDHPAPGQPVSTLSYQALHRTRVERRGSWDVGRGTWVVGRGSWVVGRGNDDLSHDPRPTTLDLQNLVLLGLADLVGLL